VGVPPWERLSLFDRALGLTLEAITSDTDVVRKVSNCLTYFQKCPKEHPLRRVAFATLSGILAAIDGDHRQPGERRFLEPQVPHVLPGVSTFHVHTTLAHLAIRTGDLLFCSGQIPLEPSTGELVKVDIEGQARRCLENLAAVA